MSNSVSTASSSRHGQILCGTIGVVDLQKSLALYQEFLELNLIERRAISATLAQCWGLPEMEGQEAALLQPPSGVESYLRLVEVPPGKAFKAATTFGWGAFEISVRDVFTLAHRLKDSAFEIVGPPMLVDGFTNFIPMQVVGPDAEVLFLNQVNHSDETTELPKAQCFVEQLFIAVVATPDRLKTVKEHVAYLGLEESSTYRLKYSLINRAFDLDLNTEQTITMVQNGRQPFGQVDQYPAAACARPNVAGSLARANSVISVMVDDLDALPIDLATQGPRRVLGGPLYRGRRVQMIQCSASERIELIER